MERKEIKKAYKKCLNLRWKKRKTVPYKELDLILYIIERYLKWTADINTCKEEG